MKLISAAVGCVIALALAAPAGAAPPFQREHYVDEGEETFTDTECGDPITIHHEFRFEGTVTWKAGRRGDPTPFYMDQYEGVETFTNVDTGNTATLTHNGLFKDLRVEHLTGTIYRFTALESGQPVVALDADGKKLVFDRGRIFHVFDVDTLGDADPSNDVFLGADDADVAGPHPIFFGDADFCDLLDLLR